MVRNCSRAVGSASVRGGVQSADRRHFWSVVFWTTGVGDDWRWWQGNDIINCTCVVPAWAGKDGGRGRDCHVAALLAMKRGAWIPAFAGKTGVSFSQ